MTTMPTQLGPYTIDREIGRGGMGVVYLGRDTKLDRAVAIKALPEHLAADPDRLARFEREARTLAQLTHANVAGIYGVEEHNGARYLVLEYVEGETLAERLDRGPLEIDEALEVCAQIAAGVEAAHEAGVIHRDLKPANVKITPDGMAKVLDFGLAKAEEGASSSGSGMSQTPTLTSPAIQHSPTIPGAILGTAAYMSPEQARGRKVDKRTDIWSFGVVLYECLVGASPFVGETVSDSIGAILHKDVELDRLPVQTPGNVRRTLERCLQRDKNERWRDIGDVRLELLAAQRGSVDRGPGAKRSRTLVAWAATCLASAAAIVAITLLLTRGTPPEEVLHAQLMPPEGFVYEYRRGPPAVSPDGRMVAFVARGEDDQRSIWLRELNRASARRLDQTQGARDPFWSPDSRSIGYFDGDNLRRIDIDGGPPDTVCEASGGEGGGSWNRDDVIIFSAGRGESLFSVASSGGRPKQVTTLDRTTNEFDHRSPWFLPDGERFLFSTRRGIGGENGVAIGSLDGGPHQRVLEVDSNAVYIEPGYVLFWRDGALRGQSFDPDSGEISGAQLVVAPQTRFEPEDMTAHFSASPNGVLVFHPGQSATVKSRLELRNRAGELISTVGPDSNYYSPRISHDGRLVAVDNSGVHNNGDIWIYGVSSATAIRLTFDPADESRPIWSPDDRRVAFLTGKNGPDDIHGKHVSNPAVVDVIHEISEFYLEPTDWSPDGKQIAFNKSHSDSGVDGDIWLLTLESGDAAPFIESPFSAEDLRFSPDGRWGVYASNETGQFEIYVQSLDDPSNRRLVSVGGAVGPKWGGDGKELIYRSLDDKVMAVGMEEGPAGPLSSPVELFEIKSRFEDAASDFDTTEDGQTFVINTAIRDDAAVPMSLVINWMADLNDK